MDLRKPWLSVLAVGAAACTEPGIENDIDDAEPAGFRIATENAGGATAEIIARRYLIDPDVTMTSYAAPGLLNGCSATLVGPNLVLTAGHCGFHEQQGIVLQTYTNLDPLSPNREQVLCERLYQTYPDTDMMPLYCPPIDGVNPGDKYGYVDFDSRSAMKNDEVYSIWNNRVDDIGGGQHRLFSKGKVTSTEAAGWFTPNGYDNTAVNTDLWTNFGSSGSAQFSRDRHQILLGPQSVGYPDARGRSTLSMLDYRLRSAVDDPANINDAAITSLGLTPSDYMGGVDKDEDLLLDVQTDLERLTGEGARDHYSLVFSSPRQNALWTNPNKFEPDDGRVQVPKQQRLRSYEPLRHQRLNLKPKTRYRISVTVLAQSTTSKGLEIGFEEDLGSGNWGTTASQTIDLVAGSGWQTHTFELTSGKRTALVARASQFGDAYLGAIDIVERGSTMDFDLHDKRLHWRNGNDGSRAFILPDGRGKGWNWSGVSWAGAVVRDESRPPTDDWPLSNGHLALLARTNYRMCFDVRGFRGHGFAGLPGRVRVTSGGSVVYEQEFDASNNVWGTLCTDEFSTKAGHNVVEFGAAAGPSDDGTPSTAVFLVDNVQIDEA